MVIPSLRHFIESEARVTTYVRHPEFSGLCVRKGWHSIGGVITKCFDIVNVTAKKQGLGSYSRLLAELDERLSGTDMRVLYVESVLDGRFQDFHLMNGFTLCRPESDPPCFYRVLAFENPAG